MKDNLLVIKIGGNVIDDPPQLERFLASFAALEMPRILIHGGGKLATAMGRQMGIETKMVEGRRITDEQTIDLVTMVYAGLVNKKICAGLQKFQCNAIGLSGCDANTIRAVKRPVKEVDYGWVGDIKEVHAENISLLLAAGIIPVFSAITHDGNGQLLNTNADTIASEVAIAMSKYYSATLIYCFEKKGVLVDLKDENSVIRQIDPFTYRDLKKQNLIHAGMLPKLENCFRALNHGVDRVKIGNGRLIEDFNSPHTTISTTSPK